MTKKQKVLVGLVLMLTLMATLPPKQLPEYQNPDLPKSMQIRWPTFSQNVVNAEQHHYVLHVVATAYWTHVGGHGIAYDGNPAVAYRTLAVDPNVIPLGSKVHVPGIGWMLAHDTGSSIKGNRIDIAMESNQAAIKWGRKELTVTVIPPQ